MRQSRGFVTGAVALALLFASQLLVSSAIASRMDATNLLLDGAEGQIICLASHSGAENSESDSSQPSRIVHKIICDACAFAAQAATATSPQPALMLGFAPSAAELALPRALLPINARHEPRSTRGPPLNA